jgi:exodeoxyribonuclease V gamma subunit
VLVGQLRDYLAAGWYRGGDTPTDADAGKNLLAALTTTYPLQPFSRCYFGAGEDARVFTYAREWQQAHQPAPAALPASTLAPWQPDVALGIGPLQRFLHKPVACFFNQRLNVFFAESNDDISDDEPFTLDGLQRYSATQAVLHAAIDPAVDDVDHAISAAAARLHDEGRLPPGGFGAALQADIAEQVKALAGEWREACAQWPLTGDKHELHYAGAGLQVEDWLTDLRRNEAGQHGRLELVSGALADKDGKLRHEKLLSAWVIHLLANANGLHMQTRLIGADAQARLNALSPEDATAQLDALLAALHEGMQSPLPIARKTAFAWLQSPKNPVTAAKACYEGNSFAHIPGEVGEDAYLARAWPSFEALQTGGFERWLALYQAVIDAASGSDA